MSSKKFNDSMTTLLLIDNFAFLFSSVAFSAYFEGLCSRITLDLDVLFDDLRFSVSLALGFLLRIALARFTTTFVYAFETILG